MRTITAIITPFTDDGALDLESLEKLIGWQLKQGVSGFVVLGTSGESSTIDPEERATLLKFCREQIPQNKEFIVGCGTNNTKTTITLVNEAKEAGADEALVVTPYYNRPSQAGILAHYHEVTRHTDIPIVLYNIPSRTGRELKLSTIRTLAENPKIKSIKHSTDSAKRLFEIACLDIELLAGSDELAFFVSSCGGAGVISASANAIPRLMCKATQGSFEAQAQAMPIIDVLFEDTNPAPAKYVLYKLGIISSPAVRLPLTPCSIEVREKIDNLIEEGTISVS